MSLQHSDLQGFRFKDDAGRELLVTGAWKVNSQYVTCTFVQADGVVMQTLRRAEQVRLLKAAEEGIHGTI